MPAFRDIFNLEFVLRGNEKNRGQNLNSRFCLLSHLWIFDWTQVKDPKHSSPYRRFFQTIYQDQIKLYETFQNLATFNQMFEHKRDKCVKNLLTNNVSISVAPLFWHHQDYPITTSDMFYNSAASRIFWDIWDIFVSIDSIRKWLLDISLWMEMGFLLLWNSRLIWEIEFWIS